MAYRLLHLLIAVLLGTTAPFLARAQDLAPEDGPRRRDCALGLLVFCLVESDVRVNAPKTKLRLELTSGYKPLNYYFHQERSSCEGAGCRLDFTGPAFALDASYNLDGNPHSDDYYDLGLAFGYLPIVSAITNNAKGFQGEFGDVLPGSGRFSYLTVRLALRRPSFFYLVKSKYLISSFGIGVAIPITSGQAGATFTGSDSVKATLGGRLGVQYPLTDTLKIGVATNWNVIWNGRDALQMIFVNSYGLSVGYQL